VAEAACGFGEPENGFGIARIGAVGLDESLIGATPVA